MLRARNNLRGQTFRWLIPRQPTFRTQRFIRSFSKSGFSSPWLYNIPAIVGAAVASFALIASKQKTLISFSDGHDSGSLASLLELYYSNKPDHTGNVADIPGFLAGKLVIERLHKYAQTKTESSVKDGLLIAMSTRLALLRDCGVEGSSPEKTTDLQIFAETESSNLKSSPFGRENSDLSLMSEDAKTAWVADGIAYFIVSDGMDEPPHSPPPKKWVEDLIARGCFERSKFMAGLSAVERVIIIELYREARKAYQKRGVREELETMGLPVAHDQDMKLTDAIMDVYWYLSKEEVLKDVFHKEFVE